MMVKTKKGPPSKTNFPGPYPGIEFFKPAPDNIISTIMGTGEAGKLMPQKNQADLYS